MNSAFVDSNLFIVYFTNDNDWQHRQAERLFRMAAQGKIELVTGPPVLFELAWTLRKSYRLTRGKTLETLASVAAIQGLRIVDRDLVAGAVELAEQCGQEFADAYIVAQARQLGLDAIATFDKADFKRLPFPLFAW